MLARIIVGGILLLAALLASMHICDIAPEATPWVFVQVMCTLLLVSILLSGGSNGNKRN